MPYDVVAAGPGPQVVESPDGPCRDFRAAKLLAAECLAGHIAACQAMLADLGLAGSFEEFVWLRQERGQQPADDSR
jgi:hypothetical protein